MIVPRLALLSTAALLAGCGATTPPPEPPVAPPVVEVTATIPDDEAPLTDAEPNEAPPEKERENQQALTDAEFARKDALKQAADAGILGVLQAGKGGSGAVGSGYGQLSGRLSARSAKPASGADAIVLGALDKDIVRRIVRSHIPKLRYCYERQLVKEPDLAGKVVLKFVIGRDGKVTTSQVVESLQPDVDACVNKIAAQMVFPKPKGGGIVIVRYPLVFSSNDDKTPKSKTPKASSKKP